MARITEEDIASLEEQYQALGHELAKDWLIKMKLYDPDKIDYTICQVTYDWHTMCKEWEDPKEWDGGQFCGNIETTTYTHPVAPERDITFTFDGDTMIDCFSKQRKSNEE